MKPTLFYYPINPFYPVLSQKRISLKLIFLFNFISGVVFVFILRAANMNISLLIIIIFWLKLTDCVCLNVITL